MAVVGMELEMAPDVVPVLVACDPLPEPEGPDLPVVVYS